MAGRGSGEAAIVLDVTRTISRAEIGRATGIDRVERAWIDWAFSPRWPRAVFLARAGGRLALIDRSGFARLLDAVEGRAPLPRRDMRARLTRRRRPRLGAMESGLRRRAAASARSAAGLSADLAAMAGEGFVFANVGHAALEAATFAAMRGAGGGARLALVHDLIPLERPDFARPDGPAKMRARLDAIAAGADAVIANSEDTAARVAGEMDARGAHPRIAAALLGVAPAAPTAPPVTGLGGAPYFIVLGTIEPRKNHMLLLDIWAGAAPPEATLVIAGRRGWENAAVFNRLDHDPALKGRVVELSGADDGEIAALIAGAVALLLPSFAEGFGLPVGEALALGAPVLASDLPAHREVGGAAADYLAPEDHAGWRAAIAAYEAPGAPRRAAQIGRIADWRAPTWEGHFAAVDALLESLGA